MIKIENVHVDNIVRAVYSARNAMNSWNRSDSDWETDSLGENDLTLAKRLSKSGNDHSKFLRMINVTFDVTAPLYWYKEFSTYKVGTVANSCSTMHKIHAKEFTIDDFSHEHLFPNIIGVGGNTVVKHGLGMLAEIVFILNAYRDDYLKTKDKRYWWQMIQLLPSSYNQKRTVQLNYQVLKAIYHARENHKLDEWREFCKWCETLPYFKEICVDTLG